MRCRSVLWQHSLVGMVEVEVNGLANQVQVVSRDMRWPSGATGARRLFPSLFHELPNDITALVGAAIYKYPLGDIHQAEMEGGGRTPDNHARSWASFPVYLLPPTGRYRGRTEHMGCMPQARNMGTAWKRIG